MSNDMPEGWRDGGYRSDGTVPAARATHGVVDLDVSWLVPADLGAVDALARLQVAASRRGRRIRLHGADGDLAELVDLMGLGAVVHLCPWCRRAEPPT